MKLISGWALFGQFAAALHGFVRLEFSHGEWRSFTDDGIDQGRTITTRSGAALDRTVSAGGESTLPLVVVRGSDADAPDSPPQITVIGGGPMNDVLESYIAMLEALLKAFQSPSGQQWWLAAGVKVLEVSYSFETEATRVRTWRGRNTLKIVIERPITSLTDSEHPELLAREDVEALVGAVRRRTGLGPHPDLHG